MEKKTDSLLFKFAAVFSIFTLTTLIIAGITTYISQTAAYKEQCKSKISNICDYLNRLMMADCDNFIQFQNYWIEHSKDIRIPLDFSGDWTKAKKDFDNLFAKTHPSKVLNEDIIFEELDEPLQKAWATYYFEYWLNNFEEARKSFGVIYTYYVVPRGVDHHLYWLIDAVREGYKNPTEDTQNMMDLSDDYFDEKLTDYPNMEEAWLTGRKPKDYDIFNNDYGKTFAFYVPFSVKGRVYGVIGTEIEVSLINKEVLRRTAKLLIQTAIILILAVLLTLKFIYTHHISKLIHLQEDVKKYTQQKDSTIAINIENKTKGNDEIDKLSSQVASMMLELENYIKNLIATTKELTTTKQLASEMNVLATKDALTGIRNKTAYDREIKRIQWQIATEKKQFGFAMIDLNFLKKINDTYGHEQGNTAIKKLCSIVCTVFRHSPVFRIGGDEFIVILENSDLENVDSLVTRFKEYMQNENEAAATPSEEVSAAIGVAIYNPKKDSGIESVFKRADKEMYINKKNMKASRE